MLPIKTTKVCEKHTKSFRVLLCSHIQRERALKGESLWRASHIHTVPLLLRAFTVTALKRDRISCCVKMALEMSLRTEQRKTLRCALSYVSAQTKKQRCCIFSLNYFPLVILNATFEI